MIKQLIELFIFPGLVFLIAYSLYVQYIDRKLYARLQNRVGPPWFQPFADTIKLFSKETIMPRNIDKVLFQILPYFSFAAVVTSFLFIPVSSLSPVFSYPGDLIIVAYLLTIPTLVLALAGWVSGTTYSVIGGIRCLTQLFSYEVPFFIALLMPAIMTGTWNIAEISQQLPGFIAANPLFLIPLFIGFVVSIISLQGKLERRPFDIPDAETEIVAGPFVEYSGRLFGIFRLAIDMELVVGAAVVAAVFLGGPHAYFGIPSFIVFLLQTLFIIIILSVIKAATARIRIDQMINFGWRILAPLSLTGLILLIILLNL